MAGTTILSNSQSTTSSDRRRLFDQHPRIPPVAQNFNNQDVFLDRKVAPYVTPETASENLKLTFPDPNRSPRAVCADLAHQHAFEDLEKNLQHSPGKKDLAGSHDLPATNADLAPQSNPE